MCRLEAIRARLALAAVVFLLALGAPGLALAQYYEYLATGTIQTVQAVAAGNAVLIKPAPGGAPALEMFAEQAGALAAGGVDCIYVETMSDLTEARVSFERVFHFLAMKSSTGTSERLFRGSSPSCAT